MSKCFNQKKQSVGTVFQEDGVTSYQKKYDLKVSKFKRCRSAHPR